MLIARRCTSNFQLFIGIVIGLICSYWLSELFRGSIIIWKISGRGQTTEFVSERNKLSTIPIKNNSLHENLRVLCWVMTYPKNHRTVAIHVKRTWGKRCDKLLFISSRKGKRHMEFWKCCCEIRDFQDSTIDSIAVPGAGDGRDWLWGKTKAALKYAWEHNKDDFDWIMKAEDDTYFSEIIRHLIPFTLAVSSILIRFHPGRVVGLVIMKKTFSNSTVLCNWIEFKLP